MEITWLTGIVRRRARQQLVEGRIAVAAAGGGRLRERDVLVQRRVLVARGGLDRGDDLARDAELREVPEARLAVGAVVANRFVEAHEALLDQIVGVSADQEVRRRLEPHEAVVALHDPVVRVLLALLGERDEVVIIKLSFRVETCDARRWAGGAVAIECSSRAEWLLEARWRATSPGARFSEVRARKPKARLQPDQRAGYARLWSPVKPCRASARSRTPARPRRSTR